MVWPISSKTYNGQLNERNLSKAIFICWCANVTVPGKWVRDRLEVVREGQAENLNQIQRHCSTFRKYYMKWHRRRKSYKM